VCVFGAIGDGFKLVGKFASIPLDDVILPLLTTFLVDVAAGGLIIGDRRNLLGTIVSKFG
jgi:hypothetical protein